jgi:hypothetical protein
MNAWFGLKLRRELVKLMSDSSGPKERSGSVNSQRLSLDSLDGDRSGRNDKDDSEDIYDQVNWAKK